jgi:hypothetical protein
MAVLPMLRRVVKAFARPVAHLQDQKEEEPPSVLIYSGHDVNLLGLLVALDASPVQNGASHWPDYGSTLVFELVRDKESPGAQLVPGCGEEEEQQQQQEEAGLRVNVYYNQEPLSIRLPATSNSNRDSAENSMRLQDLIALCNQL